MYMPSITNPYLLRSGYPQHGEHKAISKFKDKYEIIEQGIEQLTTDSGKYLELQEYILKIR